MLPEQVKGSGIETRSKHQARDALSTMLGQKRKANFDVSDEELTARFGTIFKVFDKDNSGDITASELADMMRCMGKRPLKKKIRAIITGADTDGDGKISQKEFVDFMINQHKAKQQKKKAKTTETKAESTDTATTDNTAVNGNNTVGNGSQPAPTQKHFLFEFYNLLIHSDSNVDLAVSGAFDKFSILMFAGSNAISDVQNSAIVKYLEDDKKFDVLVCDNVDVFTSKLDSYDEAWVFAGGAASDIIDSAVLNYLKSGRGILVFPSKDGASNSTLNSVLSSKGVKIAPNTDSSADQDVTFDQHLVYSGLSKVKLDEPVNSSLELGDNFKALQVGSTTFFAVADEASSGCTAGGSKSWPIPGRIAICNSDIWKKDDEIAKRLLSNTAAWLLSLDIRLLLNVDIKGGYKEPSKWMWQYYHLGWYNYDSSASDIVEGEYQNYLENPGLSDVRTVKSGYWSYCVDFLQMTQTNIVHEAHTTRNIRRIAVFD